MTKKALPAMKKAAVVFCAVLFSCLFVCLSAAGAMPESGKCGNDVTYVISGDTLTLSGTGSTFDYQNPIFDDGDSYYGPFIYNREIKHVVIGEGVTRIGQQFFSGTSLLSVTLPSTLSELGDAAFGDSELGNVYIDSLKHWCSLKFDGYLSTPCNLGGHVYADGELLGGDFVLPDDITEVGAYAFACNKDLTSLTFGASSVSFGRSAFGSCSKLTKVYADSLEQWLSMRFEDDQATPLCGSAVLYINGKKLSSVTVPGGTKELGPYCFSNIKTLTSVSLPDSLENLGDGAFARCTGLTEMTLPAGIGAIGKDLFRGCTNLVTLNCGGKITSVGAYAFYNCEKLTDFPFEEGLASLGEGAFYCCRGFTEIVIPETVTTLGSFAFYGCSGAKTLDIRSKQLTNLPYRCFDDCVGLTMIFIPGNITEAADTAFADCSPALVIYGGTEAQWKTVKKGFRSYGSCRDVLFNTNAEDCTILDGIIYSKDKTVLLRYPAGKNNSIFSVPEGVKTVASGAFRDNPNLNFILFPETLTKIEGGACTGMKSLTSVYVPSSLTSIGDSAFADCTRIKGIYEESEHKIAVGSGNELFEGAAVFARGQKLVPCENGLITEDGKTFVCYESMAADSSYTVPEGVEKIAPHAFRGAARLKTVKLPSSLREIGASAFYVCGDLTSLTLPEGLKKIGGYAFGYCRSLRKVTVPESVTSIGNNAFFNCIGLTEAVLPEKLTKIGDHFFDCCTELISVKLPSAVTSIGEYAFAYCRKLSDLTLGDKITRIGQYAFYDCNELGEIKLPKALESIGINAFMNCYKLSFSLLPEKLEVISEGAFGNCTTLRSVDIPASPVVGNEAFAGCTGLKRASFAEGTTFIPASVFKGCTALTRVFLPSTVVSLGGGCFSGCTKLSDVYYDGTKTEWNKIGNLSSDTILFAAKLHTSHTHSYSSAFIHTPEDLYLYSGLFCACEKCGQTVPKKTEASECKAPLSYTKATYNGSAKRPSVTVKDNTGKKLVKGADYTVSYSSNTAVGRAKVTVTFKGNYSGKKTLYFTIRPGNVTGLKATQTTSTVKLSWSKVPGAVTYRIYKYSSSTKKYTQIGSTKDLSYTVTGLKKGTAYTYYVKASKTVNDVKYLSAKYVKLRTATKTAAPASPVLTAGTKKITAKWSKVSGATGYELYMASSKTGTYKRVRQTVKLTYTKTELTKGKTYYFKLRTYKTVDGKKIYSAYSPVTSVKAK